MLFRANLLCRRRVSLTSPTMKAAISIRDQTDSDPAPRKHKDSENQFAGKASSAKHKKGKQQLTFKKGGSSSDDYSSEDQPEYAYLGRLWVSPTLATWWGRNLAAKIWSLSRRLSTTARGMCQNFSFKESLHLLRSSSRRH